MSFGILSSSPASVGSSHTPLQLGSSQSGMASSSLSSSAAQADSHSAASLFSRQDAASSQAGAQLQLQVSDEKKGGEEAPAKIKEKKWHLAKRSHWHIKVRDPPLPAPTPTRPADADLSEGIDRPATEAAAGAQGERGLMEAAAAGAEKKESVEAPLKKEGGEPPVKKLKIKATAIKSQPPRRD